MGNIEGKVAIITGAGKGLGREEALQLAGQGARVVISDIPAGEEDAQQTVADIKSAGGEAICVLGDCADTGDSEKLFKTALDTFGDVNIMVNNAGFCRDKTIFAMSDDEFDSVVRVHLRGHFVNMRNATAYWRNKAKEGDGTVYGRLISTSSEAALYGSAGQPNYAAAKAGIIAMTMGAAQLSIKYGVTANCIMPRALTDMTKEGISGQMFAKPEEGFHAFSPENVAPFVGYLASPEAGRISGEVFIVWGPQVQRVKRPEPAETWDNPAGQEKWTVDALHNSLSDHFNDDYKPVYDGYSLPTH